MISIRSTGSASEACAGGQTRSTATNARSAAPPTRAVMPRSSSPWAAGRDACREEHRERHGAADDERDERREPIVGVDGLGDEPGRATRRDGDTYRTH